MMYKFLYYFFYKMAVKRNPEAKDGAAVLTFGAILIHGFLIVSIVKKFVPFNFPGFNTLEGSLLYILFLLLIMNFFVKRLKKNFDSIYSEFEEKYQEKTFFTLTTILSVLLIYFVPSLLIVLLS